MKNKLAIAVGKNLREFRLMRKITVKELSKLINKPISTIRRWECGITLPPLKQIYKMSAVYQIHVGYILPTTIEI